MASSLKKHPRAGPVASKSIRFLATDQSDFPVKLCVFFLIMPEFVAAAFACNLGIGLARIAQKGHDLPCFCETKK
jgi:hypothetical protein